MSKFASKYPYILGAMVLAFGENNAAVDYDEENNASTLSSEQLGAINKHMGDIKTQLKDGNEAQQALGSQYATEVADLKAAHTTALAAKDEQLTALQNELAVLKGEKPAKPAGGASANADPNNENSHAEDNSFASIGEYLKTAL